MEIPVDVRPVRRRRLRPHLYPLPAASGPAGHDDGVRRGPRGAVYFLFKLSLAIAFKEIATSISKKARLNDEYVFYISLYYVHYINFNRFV